MAGSCAVDGPCVASPNYPSNYGANQGCTITAQSPSIQVFAKEFNTEQCCDKLTIGGTVYSKGTRINARATPAHYTVRDPSHAPATPRYRDDSPNRQ